MTDRRQLIYLFPKRNPHSAQAYALVVHVLAL